MIYDEDPLRRRPRKSTVRRMRQGGCVWVAENLGKWPFKARADLQNQAIGWLRKGFSSLGGEMVVRFPRIWLSSEVMSVKVSECYLGNMIF